MIICALLIAGCDEGVLIGQYVDYELRGTWEGAYYWSGKMEIAFNSIKITGYYGKERHLSAFTQDTTLEAYTENGNLYIKDKGVWQSPVSYKYWRSLSDEFLDLTGGGLEDETFKLKIE
jgi:hypothetical protein